MCHTQLCFKVGDNCSHAVTIQNPKWKSLLTLISWRHYASSYLWQMLLVSQASAWSLACETKMLLAVLLLAELEFVFRVKDPTSKFLGANSSTKSCPKPKNLG